MAPRKSAAVDAPVTYPEVDRLEGAPHPRETRDLFGHAAAEARLAETFAGGRMHHAWILAGPYGTGKATLAYRLARHVLARPDERDTPLLGPPSLHIPPESPTARQVAALSHPGLLVVRRAYDMQKKRTPTQITVDEVRRLRDFLTQTADAGAWRVVIVDQADEMNTNAANALLKSLEEPPRRCLFLLVASAPGRLLPTIHSRCRRLVLGPLASDDVARAVQQARVAMGGEAADLDGGDGARLLALAGGSPRRALQLLIGDGLKLSDDIHRLVEGLPRLDRGHLVRLADRLAPTTAEASYTMFWSLLDDALADAVRTAARGGGAVTTDGATPHPTAAALARLMTGTAEVAQFAGLWETLQRMRREAGELNLDRRQLILETGLRLEAVARRVTA